LEGEHLPNSLRSFFGWTTIISGIFLFTAHFINFWGETDEGTLTGSSFVLAAHVLLIFALTGIFLSQVQESKLVGLIAYVLSVLGTAFVSAIVFVEISGFTGVNTELVFKAPVASVIYTFGPLLFVFGMLLLGFAIIKARKLPKASGILLLVGTVVFALASVIPSEKLFIEMLGGAFTGLGFVWSGFPLIHPNETVLSQQNLDA
jgi:hypothetical protein